MRSARSSSTRATPTGTRSTPGPASPTPRPTPKPGWNLEVDQRRRHVDARPGQRRLQGPLDRAARDRQRGQPSRRYCPWRARRQLRYWRGDVEPAAAVAALGLYRQSGATFTSIWNGAGSVRGVNQVAVDPNTPTTLYAAAFQQGVWRSTDAGTTWMQIKDPHNAALNTDRSEFAGNKLPGGFTRMYVGDRQLDRAGVDRARFYRTNDAARCKAIFIDMTTPQNIDYCTGQCWYDNFVYSPAGIPDVVYLGGSFDYGELRRRVERPGRADVDRRRRDLERRDARRRPNDGWIHPGPARDRDRPGQAAPVLRGSTTAAWCARAGTSSTARPTATARGLTRRTSPYCQSLLNRCRTRRQPEQGSSRPCSSRACRSTRRTRNN